MTRIALFRPMAMLLLALLPCAAASAQAPPPSGKYTFTNIVDNTGPYASFGFYGPAINDSGQVAFTATLDTGGWGIFTGDDPTTDTLVHDSGPINPFDQPLSISNSGLVGFVATADEDDDGVFIGSVGAGVTRIESGDLFDPQPHRSLAYGWQVKFVLMGDNGIVTYSHFENSRVVLRTAPPLATVEGFYADNALYNANGDLFGWSSEGLVKLPGGDPNLMETLTTLPAPQFAVNANGDAVIYNKIRLSPAAIYRVMNGQAEELIADTTDYEALIPSTSSVDLTNRPAIDGDGNVAFWARTAETFLYDFGNDFADFFPIEGIFTGPDLSADRVIGTGDPLFGSTVALTRPTNSLRPINTWLDMNDSGQIAFRYQLADGRRGIAVATPLPEPGSALLLAAGAVVLMKRTRRR